MQQYFDAGFYRSSYADLGHLSDDQLREHYEVHGRREGRISTELAFREQFLAVAGAHGSILEIGPFCNPALRGRSVQYFDVLDRAGLIARADSIGYKITGDVPEIDFVSANADLNVVDREFDAVFSSHCIEHQPDLVAHLELVSRILTDDGQYYLIIPNKAYCFDYALPESSLARMLDAHVSKRTRHTLESVIEHRALTTHNDTQRHWAGDHFDPGYAGRIPARAAAAMREFDSADGSYVDVHAWQFSPASFARNVSALHEMGLSPLKPIMVCATPKGRNEFTAILGR